MHFGCKERAARCARFALQFDFMETASPLLIFDFGGRRRRFANPVRVIVATRAEEVRPALREAERAAQRGLYAAGFVAYEAAPAFDPALAVRGAGPLPLAWFGLFERPLPAPPDEAPGAFEVSAWLPSVERAAYDAAVERVRAAIGRGETYQANYTLRLRAQFRGDDLAFYEQLHAAQRAGYCAYLRLGRQRILSASPELFFQWRDGQIVTRPMKGTARRGRWLEEDEARAAALLASEKERAENLMIVDLLRNDVGRVAAVGSVGVPQLFAAERYPTVWQLTSTVSARTRPGVTLENVFAALFPCGSVTGAPKVNTMRLLAALEDSPRGAYCGAIGLVEPGGAATFSVAIRTVQLDAATGAAEYGVGGGITWDSTPAAEYAEAQAKAALLTMRWPPFELLETMRLDAGRYDLLERHLARLAASARFFGYACDLGRIRAALEAHAREHGPAARRVRLLLADDGSARVESAALTPLPPGPLHVAIASAPVFSDDRFLFHKTTRREVYEQRKADAPDCFDVLLWNERGELTEFTIGNLVLELDGRRYTPPIDCGLLAGTMRAELLERGEVADRVLLRDDLRRATDVWLVNSVRGWVRVALANDT
jgi:para-aminobenzoate synthetase/4-amino-4-deoxychorismate lyase